MALIRENGGLDVRLYVRVPETKSKMADGRHFEIRYPWAERRVLRQNPSRALGCSELQESKKI